MERQRDEQLDEALIRRLRRLDAMPVDTGNLDRRLRGRLPGPPRARWRVFSGRTRALAASLLLGAVLTGAVLVGLLSGPAEASAAHMARMHQDLISGRVAVTRVASIEQASAALLAQWPDGPELPQVPAEHVMACCMRSVKNRKMAWVLLEKDNTPISMAVARAEDMRAPDAPMHQRGGVTYYVQAVGDLNMVMTQSDQRWICLMGQIDTEQLMNLADSLRF